jgi:hypothetical protein
LALVFPHGPLCDSRPPYPKESAFAYLSRCARAEADAVRSAIDQWISGYPPEEAESLAARLRSKQDDQHLAAFFEVLLHRLLVKLGHRILAIEPKLAHTWKSPDFQLEGFYLEGISVQGGDLHAALKRKASRYGALDLPLVVAVNSSQDEAGLRRALDELWIGPRGPQRRILSAVLAVEQADPWTWRDSRLHLIRHPSAEHPLPPVDLGDGRRLGDLLA